MPSLNVIWKEPIKQLWVSTDSLNLEHLKNGSTLSALIFALQGDSPDLFLDRG
jgi:hypothetical protein